MALISFAARLFLSAPSYFLVNSHLRIETSSLGFLNLIFLLVSMSVKNVLIES